MLPIQAYREIPFYIVCLLDTDPSFIDSNSITSFISKELRADDVILKPIYLNLQICFLEFIFRAKNKVFILITGTTVILWHA